MCELFGYSGKEKRNLSKELRDFFSHSVDNPDGWGMAVFDSKGFFLDKDYKPAYKSDKLERLCDKGIGAKTMLAHIRLATVGYDEYENTHPFWGLDQTGRMWTLIHNGTIFEGSVLSRYSHFQRGSTDSERIFLYLMDEINKATERNGKPLNARARFEVIESVAANISPYNKVNFIIYDGELMYVHTNCLGTLHERTDNMGITFSTTALTDEKWEQIPMNKVLAYKDGNMVFEGASHGNEYVPDPDSIKAIFMAYAAL